MRALAERGVALLMVTTALSLLAALSAAVLVGSSLEVQIASHFRDRWAGFYAAEAIAARALDDMGAVSDWTRLLDGTSQSSFTDGQPGGLRALADGTVVNMTEAMNLANCGKTASCTASDLAATTADRPWGANNPQWRLYAWGWLRDLVAEASGSPWYLLLSVGDDPAETDNAPLVDGGGAGQAGLGVVLLRAEAFGLRGAHAAVEVTVARSPSLHVVAWRDLR